MWIEQNAISQAQTIGKFGPGGSKPLMAMIEVTNRCNMACPICYSNANDEGADVPMETIRDYMLQLLEVTQRPIPIQISGGEPTLHNELPQIIAMAKEMGFVNIELVTNGLRISSAPGYMEALKASGLSSVYLQFDGLTKDTTSKIRGRDMSQIRKRAVETIGRYGLCCTLAVVLTRGVNEKEIGSIVRYAIDHIDVIRAINFQSATRFAGRFQMDTEYRGYSLPELLCLIEAQTGIPADTFRSNAIGHPDCNAMSPVFIVNDQLKPLFQYLSNEDVDFFLKDNTREKLLSLFSGKKTFYSRYLRDPQAWKLIYKARPIFGNHPYNWVRTKHLLLFAKSFMEAGCSGQDRLGQCCFALSGDAGVVSFCAYNNYHRFNKSMTLGDCHGTS